jgi:N6-L-threonylcarbamoyladenine synthase
MSVRILAIETSCDETAAAVIFDGRIKSNIVASQAFKLHAQYGGVVPEVAAREHVSVIIPTIELALKQAKIKLKDLDYIAVTEGPGLATSLMVGVDTAKSLGAALNIPVIPINHLEGHIYANFVGKIQKTKSKKQIFPAVILTVSGGHTFLTEMKGHGKYRLLGETLDDAAGEAFDKIARMLGLGYPGGLQLSLLAQKGNPKKFNFPRPMLNSGNFEFSFSGLKTAVLYKLQELSPVTRNLKPDVAASTQQAIVDVLIAKLEKAIVRYKPKTIMLGGGVAANELLRKRFELLTTNYSLQTSIPKLEYCTDNAAMIGLAAYYRIKNKIAQTRNFSAKPNLPLR